MKRFHIHLSVNDLDKHIAFYNELFTAPATVVRDDYAKWELDDPALNFAISARGHVTGLNHLGFQVDNEEMLTALTTEAESSSCCYANSKKHWTTDPSGIAWEQYFTMGQTKYFSGDRSQTELGCC